MGKITLGGRTISKPFTINGKKLVKITSGSRTLTFEKPYKWYELRYQPHNGTANNGDVYSGSGSAFGTSFIDAAGVLKKYGTDTSGIYTSSGASPGKYYQDVGIFTSSGWASFDDYGEFAERDTGYNNFYTKNGFGWQLGPRKYSFIPEAKRAIYEINFKHGEYRSRYHEIWGWSSMFVSFEYDDRLNMLRYKVYSPNTAGIDQAKNESNLVETNAGILPKGTKKMIHRFSFTGGWIKIDLENYDNAPWIHLGGGSGVSKAATAWVSGAWIYTKDDIR